MKRDIALAVIGGEIVLGSRNAAQHDWFSVIVDATICVLLLVSVYGHQMQRRRARRRYDPVADALANNATFLATASPSKAQVERQVEALAGQADILRVLSEHRRECADNEWCAECLCGWLVPEDAEDFTAAHLAHVADVLARVDA